MSTEKRSTKTTKKRISRKQRAANRANAKKSTGPRTEAGKRRVSLNGLKHGLAGRTVFIPGEDRAAYEESCNALIADLAPANATELDVAQAIADDCWRLERARNVSENLFAASPGNAVSCADPAMQAAVNGARSFVEHAERLLLMSLYEQRIYCQLHKSRAAIRQFRVAREEHMSRLIKDLSESAAPNGFGYANDVTSPIA